MAKKDYSKLKRGDLLKIIEKLESQKKYGLVWDEEKVKEKFENESESALPILKEVKDKEIKTDPNKPTNILIEGDNYHALSVLNYTHQGKIDVIYIDPPYNTGNKDFKYNDNFVEKDDAYRHSKWLSFMSKRLRLAKNLLKDNGVFFISIDDNEHSNLVLLCKEIFGEKNVETYIWNVKDETEGAMPKTAKHTVRKEHEYIIACFLDKNQIKFNKYLAYTYAENGDWVNPDNDPRGEWMSGNISRGVGGKPGSKFYEILSPTGKKYARNWSITSEEYKDLLKNNRIYFGKNGNGVPRIKIFKNEAKSVIQSSIFTNLKSSIAGKKLIIDILGKCDFDHPKPIELIQRLVVVASNKNAIILDFFAGTGTTGQAVLNLNKIAEANRSFILCTNNEENICTDICYPRVQRVIKGYKKDKNKKVEELGGNLKYYKTAFVKKTICRDDLKMRITRECTEMLCLREGIFDEVKAKPDYHIFKQNDRILGVYYSMERESLTQLKKELDKMEGEKTLYCFTLDPFGLDKNDFEDWIDIRLEPIPQKILDIYKEIYN